MRYYILLVLACFTMTAFAQETMPDMVIKNLAGESVNLHDIAKEHKLTVISFWATWCSPCKKELDAIADLYPEWQKKYDVELLAVTIDTQRALNSKVPALVEAKGWDYTMLSDENQELKKSMGFQTVPQTYIIDENGNIVYDHSGYTPGDQYELEDKIKELVGK